MKRALLAITLCTALTACGSSAVTVAPSPKARLAAIVKGVRAQRSVHYATRSSFGYTITADVARGRGIKLFTLRYGTRTSHLTVVLVGGVAYIRGDKGGLGTLGLFRPGTAARYAGRWISIPSSDRGYSAASAGASLESVTTS